MKLPYSRSPIPYLLAAALAVPASAQLADPPDWAADAVWYQIFPERFRNGDPTNDPTWASLEFPETVPETWAVSDWTADWYARAPWEEAAGPNFYDDGVFNRRHGGDLQGVLDKLGYLDSLGVSAIYFNPVFYAASLHKYDAASFHHIDPFFGPDPEGDLALIASETADPASWHWTAADSLFLDLIARARARGIRIVVDGVFNHTGTRFFAFRDIAERQAASPYVDWYLVKQFDDPATPDTNEFDWEGWWGYKPLPLFADAADGADLHPGPKAHVFDITRRWMDPDGDGDPSDGVDGWRLDVAEDVPVGFWRDWHALVFSLNPEAYTVAEIWGDATDFLAEGGFTATKNYFGFAIPTEAFLIDGRIGAEAYARVLADRTAAYTPETARVLMNLIDSHDTDRVASMIVNRRMRTHYDRDVSPRTREDYGVRAPNAAERDLQRMIVALQATLVGAPMVYYGDEAGMWGADDPDDRKPMVWPDLTFAPECTHPLGRPRACDPVAFDPEMFDFYRRAFRLRAQTPALRYGSFEILAADDSTQTLAFARRHEGDEVVVMLNRSDRPQRVRFGQQGTDTPLVPVFASRGDVADVPSLNVTLPEAGGLLFSNEIPPRAVVVFRRVDETE